MRLLLGALALALVLVPPSARAECATAKVSACRRRCGRDESKRLSQECRLQSREGVRRKGCKALCEADQNCVALETWRLRDGSWFCETFACATRAGPPWGKQEGLGRFWSFDVQGCPRVEQQACTLGDQREDRQQPRSLGAQSVAPKRPNIVFILLDDVGVGDVGLRQLGQSQNKPNQIVTKRIQEMADGGITFTTAYAPDSVCMPSRHSMLVGRQIGNCKVRGNSGVGRDLPFDAEDVTLAQILQDSGYHTGIIGKWGLGSHDEGSHPLDVGFNYFYGQLTHVDCHSCFPERLHENEGQVFNANVNIGNNARANERRCQVDARGDPSPCSFVHDLYTAKASEFIRARAAEKDTPFFLFLSYTVPHVCSWTSDAAGPQQKVAPFSEPDCVQNLKVDHVERGQRGVPREECRHKSLMENYIDADVGAMMDLLHELEIADDTLLVLAGDNGPEYNALRDNSKDRRAGQVCLHSIETFHSTDGLRGKKREVFEGSLRTPLVMSWPGTIAPGAVSDEPVVLFDLFATFADLAGVARNDLPQVMDGVSLLPTLVGQPQDQESHLWLYWEYCHQQVRNWNAIKERPSSYCSWAVRAGGFKLVYDFVTQSLSLFDLDADPSESNDLLGTSQSEQQAYLTCWREKEAYQSLESLGFRP